MPKSFDRTAIAHFLALMRLRNFIPLFLFLLLTALPGLAFLYLWEKHVFVLLGMQVLHAVLMFLTYRAGIHSAKKNSTRSFELGKIVYLPMKINVVLYFLIGAPLIVKFSDSATALMWAFGAGMVGFILTYTSGVTYVTRSLPE